MTGTRVVVGNPRRGGAWGAWGRFVLIAITWLLIAAPVVASVLALTIVRHWARDLPPIPDLAAWQASAPRTSRIVAADGTVLDELPFIDGKQIGRRDLARAEELPPILVQAILAAEDVRFWSHPGVDVRAIVRAAWLNYRAGRVTSGASTITQQLARNLLPDDIGTSRSARRKVREGLLAVELERHASKADILVAYANLVFLGDNAYGVKAATRAYFDEPLAALTAEQAALLAGLIQAPARLDPWRHPKAARTRRDEVLARMQRAGFLDEPARAAAAAHDLELHRPSPPSGELAPWYVEQARRVVHDEFPDQLARGGLTIVVAAQPALTQLAVHAADENAKTLAEAPQPLGRFSNSGSKTNQILATSSQAAALIWDHHTGYVEALLGGRDGGGQFDRMLQSCRQPGSAWKPIVYAAALQRDAITEGTALRDAPISEYDEATDVHWRPHSGEGFRGVALAIDALAMSLNAPAINVFDRVGAAAIIELARNLGITTPIATVRPMALGASCVKPIELARAYAIIARGGWSIEPHFALRVQRDGDDPFIEVRVPDDANLSAATRLDRFAAVAGAEPDERIGAGGGQRVDARTAFLITDMMTQVIARGTAASARNLGRPAAGKTGTTNGNTDAWFIGFSARIVAAVWVGFDDPHSILGPHQDGAHAALPLWIALVRAAEGDRPAMMVPGPPPPGLERAHIDRETGLLAPNGDGMSLWFKSGTAPTETAGRQTSTGDDFDRATRDF